MGGTKVAFDCQRATNHGAIDAASCAKTVPFAARRTISAAMTGMERAAEDMKTGKNADKNVESKCQPDTIITGIMLWHDWGTGVGGVMGSEMTGNGQLYLSQEKNREKRL